MLIPKATIEEIRDRVDIAEVVGRFVTLKRRGSSHVGLCPFHQEKSPSFNVIPHKQIYHCFGCGEGGDVFSFLMKLQGLQFGEAAKELASQVGVTIEERLLTPDEQARVSRRASLHDACREAAEWFHTVLMSRPEGAGAREYLKGRGIRPETAQRFRLGFAPEGWTPLLDHLHSKGVTPQLAVRAGLARHNEDRGSHYDFFRNRVMVPILDHRDRPIAFGGRLLEGEGAKYFNSPETDIYDKSQTLYGLGLARRAIQQKGRAIVVEGYFDVIALAQEGFEEAVATCGTALTPAHMQKLRRLTQTAVALFDTDEAGQRAAEKSLPLFLEAEVEALHLELPGAKDPDEFIRASGAEAFEAALNRSRPLLEQVVDRSIQRHGTSANGRGRAVSEIAPLLRQLRGVARSDMLMKISSALGVPERALREQLGRGPEQRPSHSAPTRWVGDKQLNRLLWLLIHFPDHAGPVVANIADPAFVTDRPDVGRVVMRLLQQADLPTILDDVDDPQVKGLLQHLAAREGFCEEDQAVREAKQILARMERRHVEQRLRELHLSIRQADADPARVLELLKERVTLQQRVKELMPITHGAARDE